MTAIANERGMDRVKLPRSILTVVSIVLMSALFWATVHLLVWAIDTKLSRNTQSQNTEITAEIREHQLGCLAKNIYHEAGNEPFEGKAAVAQIVLNRTASGQFPGDVCKTIYQKNVIYDKVICQFSWYCDREVRFRPVNQKSYDESMEVAKRVLLEGFRLPSLDKALFYHADYISPGWNRKKIAHIGHHIFYE